jgi:hypothetical protein
MVEKETVRDQEPFPLPPSGKRSIGKKHPDFERPAVSVEVNGESAL